MHYENIDGVIYSFLISTEVDSAEATLKLFEQDKMNLVSTDDVNNIHIYSYQYDSTETSLYMMDVKGIFVFIKCNQNINNEKILQELKSFTFTKIGDLINVKEQ